MLFKKFKQTKEEKILTELVKLMKQKNYRYFCITTNKRDEHKYTICLTGTKEKTKKDNECSLTYYDVKNFYI